MSTTIERLSSYQIFDEDVVERVAQVAHDQNRSSFAELADQHGLQDGPQRFRAPEQRSPLEYVHFQPAGDYDETKVRLLMTPMNTPVDNNMAMRALRLFAADPSAPLVVAGAPAAIGNRSNLPNLRELPKIWQGDLRALVRPALRYLMDETDALWIDAIGYSYGADAAASAAAEALEYTLEVDRAVLMEPASTADRGLLKLGQAFQSSEAPLQGYVDATESQPLFEARRQSDVGMARYLGGLMRLSNVAIAHALSSNSFPARVAQALDAQPALRTTIVWGQNSELADGQNLAAAVADLHKRYGRFREVYGTARYHYGQPRVNSLVVPNMHHAGADDIDLHAALVLQSLRTTWPKA